MTTLIYLTGPQGSGKTTLAKALKSSLVIDLQGEPILESHIIEIERREFLNENVVVITQIFDLNLYNRLRKTAKVCNFAFYDLALKSKITNTNILEQADKIVNQRAEEKERQYGPFEDSMDNMRDIFNSLTGLDLTTEHMYKAMIAAKFARERFAHKEDNLLDACAYIGSLNNYIVNQPGNKEN